MNVERCKKVVAAIDTLSKTEIEELFRMIHRERYEYTKNNHGVFINLTWIPDSLLTQMERYIDFCHKSKHELQKYESICDVLNTKMNETKDDVATLSAPSFVYDVVKADDLDTKTVSRVSTSMKFYLLKKRFSKMANNMYNYENDLKPEAYLIHT